MGSDEKITQPTFFCLTESDLGVPVYSQEELARGDHVSWPRCCGYWHHAIIEYEVNEEEKEKFDVIEMSSRYPCGPIVPSSETLSWSSNGGLHKMKYPSRVTAQNSPEKVLERAGQETTDQTPWNPMTNNCEHLATYCKTGYRQSLQIKRRCPSVIYNFLKIICLLGYIVVIAYVYDCIEVEDVRDHWIGFVVLPLFFEVPRRGFTIFIIIFCDKRTLQKWFDKGDLRRGRCCCDFPIVCRKAIIRKLVKSFIIMALFMEGALLIIRFVKPLSELRNQQPTYLVFCYNRQ